MMGKVHDSIPPVIKGVFRLNCFIYSYEVNTFSCMAIVKNGLLDHNSLCLHVHRCDLSKFHYGLVLWSFFNGNISEALLWIRKSERFSFFLSFLQSACLWRAENPTLKKWAWCCHGDGVRVPGWVACLRHGRDFRCLEMRDHTSLLRDHVLLYVSTPSSMDVHQNKVPACHCVRGTLSE